MPPTTSEDALHLFEREHRALRSRLTTVGHTVTGADGEPAGLVPRLRAEVPELREQLLRYCRLECEILQAVVLMDDREAERSADAEARCEVARQLLERMEALSNIGDDATFLAVFRFLTGHVLTHLDATEEEVLPIAREHLDLDTLTRRVHDITDDAELMPAGTRTADGRLDIGTGEDRSPPIS